LKADIKGQAEPKLISVKCEASILIADVNVDSVHAEIRVRPIRTKTGLIRQTE
jgi:hypothetical protein